MRSAPFSPQVLAGQVLPAVAPLCADSSKEVRIAAIKCVHVVVGRLQKMSEGVVDAAGVTETRKPQDAKPGEDGGYLSWAMSSLKTTLYGEDAEKGKEKHQATDGPGAQRSPQPPRQQQQQQQQQQHGEQVWASRGVLERLTTVGGG